MLAEIVLVMDNQNDKLEIIGKTKIKMNFNSENVDAVSSKEFAEMDYNGSSYINKCNTNFELNDKNQILKAGETYLFFRGENCSEKEKRPDYSLNVLNFFNEFPSEILDNKLTELSKYPLLPTVSDCIKTSDTSRAFSSGGESFSVHKDESKYLDSEIESSERDGQATVSHVPESKVVFFDTIKKGDFCNNIETCVFITNNDDSVDDHYANTDYLLRTSSTRDDSWEKETSSIDYSFHSNAGTYSTETVVLPRDLQTKMHVSQLTGISFNDRNMDSGKSKDVCINIDSIQIQSSKTALGQVITESSDDEDSIDIDSDTDESFSWYYNQPEDFIDEPESNLAPQAADTLVVNELAKISLDDVQRKTSYTNYDYTILCAKSDSTKYFDSTDVESIDKSTRDESFSWWYNESNFMDERLTTDFQDDVLVPISNTDESVAISSNLVSPDAKKVMSRDIALDRYPSTDDNNSTTASTFRDKSFFWCYVEPENLTNEYISTSSNLPSNVSFVLDEDSTTSPITDNKDLFSLSVNDKKFTHD